MVRIRLQRHGRRKRPFYHIVIADARAPRDGRFIEKIGTYNPMTKPATIDLDRDKAFEWLMKGAQPSDTVRAILKVNGVLFRKHLQRGVDKGALTQEEADKRYVEYVGKKDESFRKRFEETAREQEAFRVKVAGVAPKIEMPEEVEAAAEAPAAEAAHEAAESADETPADGEPAAEAPDAQTPEAAAPGEEPAEVAEATSPNAEAAVAEGDSAEPDVHSAVDTAENNAEEAPAEETKEA